MDFLIKALKTSLEWSVSYGILNPKKIEVLKSALIILWAMVNKQNQVRTLQNNKNRLTKHARQII